MSTSDKIGIVRPFRLGAAGIVTGSGEALRESRIRTILGMAGTSAGILGELPWDHRRGNKLEALRNGANTPVLHELAVIHCGDTLAEALPEEQLVGVDVVDDGTTLSLVTWCQRVADRSPSPRETMVTTAIKRQQR